MSLHTTPKVGRVEHGSDATTEGIRVVVRPFFLPDQSDPRIGKYAWGYRIRITNTGARRVKLLRRWWLIINEDGERKEVRGDGVVGHQPDLSPGQHFEYTSYCPLESRWGTMEGSYSFMEFDGENEAREFEVRVARFFLVSPQG